MESIRLMKKCCLLYRLGQYREHQPISISPQVCEPRPLRLGRQLEDWHLIGSYAASKPQSLDTSIGCLVHMRMTSPLQHPEAISFLIKDVSVGVSEMSLHQQLEL